MTTKDYKKAFILLTSLFFMWGLITVMNDVLINSFKDIFDLSPSKRALVQFAFFIAFFIISLSYFLFSSITGKDPINKIGYDKGMIISLIICGLGCISFYPASLLNSYWAFLGALFLLASGVTGLQICANPYATILGRKESSTSRLNLAQGFNSLGTTIGPMIGAILIYQIFSNGSSTVTSVSTTYLIYGLVFFALAFLVKIAKMPSFLSEEKIEGGIGVFKYRNLSFGILAIFFYVGSEVSVGSWIVEFAKDESIMGLNNIDAHYFLSYFWGGLLIGRLVGSVALNDIAKNKIIKMILIGLGVFLFLYLVTNLQQENDSFGFSLVYQYTYFIGLLILAFWISKNEAAKSLVVFSVINVALLSIAIFSSGELAFWSLIGTGMFFSIGWSNIFSLAIKGLGKYTSQGSSLLVMAIVGGAILPFIQSKIIENYNIQISFIIPLIGMIYLIFYGLIGHKQNE